MSRDGHALLVPLTVTGVGLSVSNRAPAFDGCRENGVEIVLDTHISRDAGKAFDPAEGPLYVIDGGGHNRQSAVSQREFEQLVD